MVTTPNPEWVTQQGFISYSQCTSAMGWLILWLCCMFLLHAEDWVQCFSTHFYSFLYLFGYFMYISTLIFFCQFPHPRINYTPLRAVSPTLRIYSLSWKSSIHPHLMGRRKHLMERRKPCDAPRGSAWTWLLSCLSAHIPLAKSSHRNMLNVNGIMKYSPPIRKQWML